MASDDALTAPMAEPFSPLKLFVCTYESVVRGVAQTTLPAELIHVLELGGGIMGLHCNFAHKFRPGYEKVRKIKPAKKAKRGGLAPKVARPRKPQGDGTCFNSAVEVNIRPDTADAGMPGALHDLLRVRPDKEYSLKFFPASGITQVTGVICANLEDGVYIMDLWARYLTTSGAAAPAEARVTQARPLMINFKSELVRRSNRVLLNLDAIADYLDDVRAAAGLAETVGRLVETDPRGVARAEQALKASSLRAWVLYTGGGAGAPFPVREICHVQDSQNISCKFVTADGRKIRLNLFYKGKLNILGAEDHESGRAIYAYIMGIMRENWQLFVGIQPLTDRERRKLRKLRKLRKSIRTAKKQKAALPKSFDISDVELDAILANVFGTPPPLAPTAPATPLAGPLATPEAPTLAGTLATPETPTLAGTLATPSPESLDG